MRPGKRRLATANHFLRFPAKAGLSWERTNHTRYLANLQGCRCGMLLLRTQRSAVHSESLPVKKVANRPRVVIIGGGFRGLFAAKSLACQLSAVTMFDSRTHLTCQPSLIQT